MKVYNTFGSKILIDASYSEIAYLSVILEEYVAKDPDDSIARETLNKLRNPEVVEGLSIAQNIDVPLSKTRYL